VHRKELTKRREMAIKKIRRDLKFVSINECEFDELYDKYEDTLLKEQLEIELDTTFLQPRDFYFGGRVNATVLHEECDRDNFEMKYYDFTSLYPDVMKNQRFPLGEFF
jgi:DNA polymerase type B, organellar and viral